MIIEKYYTLKELWKNIDKLPSKRKYLAGGTDISISNNYGNENFECLIDISDILELNKIKENKKDIFIGSAVKISQLEENSLIKKHFPALIETIIYYASPSIRNMATLGGNYANASPCADGVCSLAASRAKVILNLKNKKRILPVLTILKGPKLIDLKRDEIIEGFILPKWDHKALFYKMMPRKLFGISKASLCICYQMKDGILVDLTISLASVAPTIILAEKTAEFLRGKKISIENINKAIDIIKTEIKPIDDIRSNLEYRKEIISVFLKRGLSKIIMEDL